MREREEGKEGGRKEVGGKEGGRRREESRKGGHWKRESENPLVETLSIYSSLMQSGYKSACIVTCTCMWSSGMAVTVSVVSSCRSGLPVRTELKETSVMHRLWSSLMPVTIR